MAKLIPALQSCLSRMQAGEKRFAYRLESHLEDDYLCWYEIPVGNRQKYSDFIILHPQRGLLLLELKDWKLDTIQKIDKVSVSIITSTGLKAVSNPLEQARQCTYQLINKLQKDPQLLTPSGRYQGQLVFPYGYGVVLSNITRQQFNSTDLAEVLPTHRIICKDEMYENMDVEDFQQHLWKMFNFQFPKPMTLPQVDRIRGHLFPEIRIGGNIQTDLFSDMENIETVMPDVIKVMDIQQELLARSMGDGHRVIHGVAGSGKTLILGYRCIHLAQTLKKPILVLCYNITLAARLRELMVERGISDEVNVYHFHDWCGEQLRTYHIERPASGDAYYDRLVQSVIDAADNNRIPKGQYAAVMIDEGHDFEADWISLVVNMLDPEVNSLLLLYDDAQSIYGNRKQLDFSLSSVGVQARGRTTILKMNYRNTDEIFRFAYQFAFRYLNTGDKEEDSIPLIEPESAGRNGPVPVVKSFESYEQEANYIARMFNRLHKEQDIPWSNMCVTYRQNWMGKKLNIAFDAENLPCKLLEKAKDKKRFKSAEETVKLMTMHSSKGLEFPVVAVSGIGNMPQEGADIAAEAKLLYVAMTRSTEKLLLTHHRKSKFVEQLLSVNL